MTGPGGLQVGDTLYDSDGPPVTFPPIPTFAPERFATVRNRDTAKYKQFRSGIARLDEEGVIHVLRRPEYGDQEPIFAGVGQLQFEVAAYRMETEFNCPITLSPAQWRFARLVSPDDAAKVEGQRGTVTAQDSRGRWLVLFASDYALQWAVEDHPDVAFGELGVTREPQPA